MTALATPIAFEIADKYQHRWKECEERKEVVVDLGVVCTAKKLTFCVKH